MENNPSFDTPIRTPSAFYDKLTHVEKSLMKILISRQEEKIGELWSTIKGLEKKIADLESRRDADETNGPHAGYRWVTSQLTKDQHDIVNAAIRSYYESESGHRYALEQIPPPLKLALPDFYSKIQEMDPRIKYFFPRLLNNFRGSVKGFTNILIYHVEKFNIDKRKEWVANGSIGYPPEVIDAPVGLVVHSGRKTRCMNWVLENLIPLSEQLKHITKDSPYWNIYKNYINSLITHEIDYIEGRLFPIGYAKKGS
jgi:hypothetical protein